jgi:glycine cleavage system aminomethyltransferase T/glycine/D-amino acid oxidase-like deaminating enzyme
MSPVAAPFVDAARIVVIGGGIMGSSTAYHLALNGETDVVVLERSKLTSGTTWHAAGQVRALRPSANFTRLIRYSIDLYSRLEAETGQSTGWNQTGSLSLATNPDRLTALERQISLGKVFGLDAHPVSVAEAAQLWPLARTDDLVGAVFSPSDGRVNPSDTTAALVKGARSRGVRFFEDTPVTGFEKTNGRVSAVITERGRIRCEAAVICSGLWSRQVAALAGAPAPLYACEHFYMLTKPIDGIDRHFPTLSDQDGYLYIRDEVGGILAGCFEPNAKALPLENLPKDFSFDLLNEDWDHFEPMMLNAIHRVPALEHAQVRMLLNGPESFTLDGNFMIGESPYVDGLFLGCGFNSVGIASSGGAGRALAEWILQGEPTMDLWEVDVRRFSAFQNNLRALHERIPEVLSDHHPIPYPGRHPKTVRGLRCTPLHEELARRGAYFGTRSGWERAEWFRTGEDSGEGPLTFGRPPWFELMAGEHRAAREAVVIIDQSSFGKILAQGPDAELYMNRMCANELAVPTNRVVYTPLLNDGGGIESDVTVQRLGGESYLIVTGTGQLARDFAWLRRHLHTDERVVLSDVTSREAVIGVAGPRSRELLTRLSSSDWSGIDFAPYTWKEIDVGYAVVRAARLSYTGELGWELYVPTEFAASVYKTLVTAGTDLNLRNVGTLALNSLRAERGFRAWGHELDADTTPLEAGVGFVARTDKPSDFIGRDAILRQREEGMKRRLAFATLEDPEGYPIGSEPILHDGEVVGQVTSAVFGHTLGRALVMGYVAGTREEIARRIASGGFGVEIAGRQFAANASLDAPLAARTST